MWWHSTAVTVFKPTRNGFLFLMQLSFLIKLIRHLEGLLFCLHCPAHSYKTRTRWSLSQWVLGSQSGCRNVCRCWLVGGGGGSLECSVAPGLGFYTKRQQVWANALTAIHRPDPCLVGQNIQRYNQVTVLYSRNYRLLNDFNRTTELELIEYRSTETHFDSCSEICAWGGGCPV